MNLEECYRALGGDYNSALSHLRLPDRIERFVRRFPSDPSYDLLIMSIEQNDMQGAFRAAHTLKGLCQNLSFTKLGKSAANLTNALRPGSPLAADYGEMLTQVIQDYEQAISAIGSLED